MTHIYDIEQEHVSTYKNNQADNKYQSAQKRLNKTLKLWLL